MNDPTTDPGNVWVQCQVNARAKTIAMYAALSQMLQCVSPIRMCSSDSNFCRFLKHVEILPDLPFACILTRSHMNSLPFAREFGRKKCNKMKLGWRFFALCRIKRAAADLWRASASDEVDLAVGTLGLRMIGCRVGLNRRAASLLPHVISECFGTLRF